MLEQQPLQHGQRIRGQAKKMWAAYENFVYPEIIPRIFRPSYKGRFKIKT